MDREAFLDAQLWLRKLPPTDGVLDWPVVSAAEARQYASQSDSGSRGWLHAVLPPRPTEHLSADAQPSTPPLALASYCCFQIGPRYCFFRSTEAGQDQTQLQIEVLAATKRASDCADASDGHLESRLVVRFDKNLVYELDVANGVDMVFPSDLTPAREAQGGGENGGRHPPRHEQPPSGLLQFRGGITLRVWIDPSLVQPAAARDVLTKVLHQVKLHAARSQQSLGDKVKQPDALSWRRVFRHNSMIEGKLQHADDVSGFDQLSPATLLERATAVLGEEGDIVAVKAIVAKIVSTRQRRARSRSGVVVVTHSDPNERSRAHSTDEDRAHHNAILSSLEIVELVTELLHAFDPDHRGMNELLGYFRPGLETPCTSHDHCHTLAPLPGTDTSTCSTAKWSSWDEYLDLASHVLSRKRQRWDPRRSLLCSCSSRRLTLCLLRVRLSRLDSTSDPTPVQAAAEAFRRAVVDEEDHLRWTRRTHHTNTHIVS